MIDHSWLQVPAALHSSSGSTFHCLQGFGGCHADEALSGVTHRTEVMAWKGDKEEDGHASKKVNARKLRHGIRKSNGEK